MIASEFMTKDVKTCLVTDTVKIAAELMVQNKFSVMPVVDSSDQLVGIVTESDFVGKDVEIPHALGSIKGLLGELYHSDGDIEQIYSDAKSKPLSEVMTKKPVSVGPKATLDDVANLMSRRQLKRLPVTQDGKLVGIITRKDLLKAFLAVK